MTQPPVQIAPTIADMETEVDRLRIREKELHSELVAMPNAMAKAGHEAERLFSFHHLGWQTNGAVGPPPSMEELLQEHVGPLKARETEAAAEYQEVKALHLEAVARLEDARAANADERMKPFVAAMADLTAQRDRLTQEIAKVNAARSGIARERDEAGGRASQAAHDARLLRQRMQR